MKRGEIMKFIDEDKYKNLKGIYKIFQVSTGITYIGQTKMRFIKRYWNHVWKLKNGSHDNNYLQNAWNKKGADDFKFQVVHILKENEDLNELEIMYISKYDTFNNGFNLTTGGEGKNDCPTSEHAKKIIGEKNRLHNLGKKHSNETKMKMRKSSPHRKLTEEQHNILLKSRIGSKHSNKSKEKMKKSHLGSNNVVSIINEKQALEIKKRLINNGRIIDISNNLNISYPIIKSILQCKVWNQVYVKGWDEFVIKYNNKKKKVLSDDQVRKIRLLLKKGYTTKEIANVCNIGVSIVYGIKQDRTYKNII